MKRDTNDRRKLGLRRQTLRTLAPVPDDQLRRVAGGTYYYYTTWCGDDCDNAGRSATGSANCRG